MKHFLIILVFLFVQLILHSYNCVATNDDNKELKYLIESTPKTQNSMLFSSRLFLSKAMDDALKSNNELTQGIVLLYYYHYFKSLNKDVDAEKNLKQVQKTLLKLEAQQEKYATDSLAHLFLIGYAKIVLARKISDKEVLSFYTKHSSLFKTAKARIILHTQVANNYMNEDVFDSAIYYCKLLLKEGTIANDETAQSVAIGNLGHIYLDYEKNPNYDLSKGIVYSKRAILLAKKLNNIGEILFNTTSVQDALLKLKKYEEVIEVGNETQRLLGKKFDSNSAANHAAIIFWNNAEALFHLGRYAEAYNVQVQSTEKTEIQVFQVKETNTERFNNLKKTILTEVELEKSQLENKVKLAELQEERNLRYGLTLVIVIAAAAGFVSYRSYKQKEVSSERLSIAHAQLMEKNKEISDSLQYAQRIQNALLHSQEQLQKIMPNSFIYFLPKDVVSGDFYWFEQRGDLFLLTVADCTGHGIPGSMMSTLGINQLQQFIDDDSIQSPAGVLNALNSKLSKMLSAQGSLSAINDGMDIAFIELNTKTLLLRYSGANRPLWIMKSSSIPEGEDNSISLSKFSPKEISVAIEKDELSCLVEIKPDKKYIGGAFEEKLFTQHEIQLQKGDVVYLCTDGYADQFGGGNNKKITTKKFKKLLETNASQSMVEQKQILHDFYTNWKKDTTQIDDVLVIGLKV